MKKEIHILLICIITISFIFPSISANPSVPITDPGTSGLPENPGPYLMDSNRSDLRFTYEYVYIQIGNVIESHPVFNATYIITNSGINWINQTIAIPGLEILDNATLTLDGNNVTWWYQYGVYVEDYIWDGGTFGCYLLNITFAPFQSRTINIESKIQFHVYFDTNPKLGSGNLSMKYIVMTGNSWVGGIGEADLVVEFDGSYLNKVTNSTLIDYNYQNETGIVRLKYHYTDWHPTTNLRVCWIPKNWPITVNATVSEDSIYRINENITIELDSDFIYSISYMCDFGDGIIANWSSNSTITHNYSTPGTYTITIWARDGFYKAVSEPVYLTITIEEEGSQGIPGFGFELIILATIIGSLIYRRKIK